MLYNVLYILKLLQTVTIVDDVPLYFLSFKVFVGHSEQNMKTVT